MVNLTKFIENQLITNTMYAKGFFLESHQTVLVVWLYKKLLGLAFWNKTENTNGARAPWWTFFFEKFKNNI
jgi:hypothetical protein